MHIRYGSSNTQFINYIKIDKIISHRPLGVSNSPHPFNSVSKNADGIVVVVEVVVSRRRSFDRNN